MTYFEALGEALRDLLEPAAVGATKVTTKGPKNSALADADVTVDVNGAARAIAVDAKQTFELPIDGVKLVAKANHHGDLSADVAASGLGAERTRRGGGGLGAGHRERDDRGEARDRFRRHHG